MSLKILIVDDERRNLDALLGFFKIFDYEDIVGIQTPQEAIVFIKESKPDLVFLDISFGAREAVTGIDVLKEVRQTTPESKIVMVSAHSHYEPEARALGCYDYVLKPFPSETLLKIAEIVDKQRGQS